MSSCYLFFDCKHVILQLSGNFCAIYRMVRPLVAVWTDCGDVRWRVWAIICEPQEMVDLKETASTFIYERRGLMAALANPSSAH